MFDHNLNLLNSIDFTIEDKIYLDKRMLLFAIYQLTNSCQSSPQWKEVEKDGIEWRVCNQDDKIVQKVCDVVLLPHPEGFLVGGKQQPGTSSHPHPSRLLAPDPLIRVSVITPPTPPPPTPLSAPAQDGNSTLNTGQQQPEQGHHP